MEKFRTTAKALKAEYNDGKDVISLGFCWAQNLLRHKYPTEYNYGIYGWNFDVYRINGKILCTGYRNTVGRSVDCDIVREYEKKAYEIWCNYSISWEEQCQLVDNLLNEFLEKI